MATLAEISDKISKGNEGIELNRDELIGIRGGFDEFFRYLKASTGDKLEASRERARPKPAGRTSRRSGGKGFNPFAGGLAALGAIAAQIAGIIGGITAGILALVGALEGLRGWEVKALANLDKIGKALRALIPLKLIDSIAGLFTPDGYKTFSDFFTEKIRNLRIKTIKAFGFDATLKKFNDPESGLKTSLGAQILERVRKFRTSILNSIGIGADGKAIIKTGPDGKPMVPLAGRITGAIQDLLAPVVKFADGIRDFIAGAGAGLFKFLGSLGIVKAAGSAAGAAGGAVAGVAKLAGKILLPLGILFSAFDAFEAWQNTEGSFTKKFTAASFAFLGDFIGAPLDLLKKGIVFLYRKALGLEVDDDGNIVGDGFAAAVGKALQGFSFEEAIKAIPNFVMSIFDSVAQFFKDPIGTAKDIIGGLIDSVKSMFFGIVKSVAAAFGIELKSDQEKAEELSSDISKKIMALQGGKVIDPRQFGITGGNYFAAENKITEEIAKLRAMDPARATQLEALRLERQGRLSPGASMAMYGSGNQSTYVDQGTTFTLPNNLDSEGKGFQHAAD